MRSVSSKLLGDFQNKQSEREESFNFVATDDWACGQGILVAPKVICFQI